jgi:hypothetical protein
MANVILHEFIGTHRDDRQKLDVAAAKVRAASLPLVS